MRFRDFHRFESYGRPRKNKNSKKSLGTIGKHPWDNPNPGGKSRGDRKRSKSNRIFHGFLKNHHFEAAARIAILKSLQLSKSIEKL